MKQSHGPSGSPGARALRAKRLHRAPRLLLAGAALVASVVPLALLGGCSPGTDEAAAATERDPGGPSDEAKVEAAESQIDDAILHFEIKAQLLGSLGWDAVGIDIDTLDGRVLLTGEVPNRSSRELAEEIVASVDGVHHVDSELKLAGKPRDETPREAVDDQLTEAESEVRDALLESRLKARLLEEVGRHALDIEIEAASGVVTLRGRLANDAQERLVLEAVSSTKGVKRVINLIKT